QQQAQKGRQYMRCGCQSQGHSKQDHPQAPLPARALHSVRQPYRSIENSVESPRRENLIVRTDANTDHLRRETIKSKRKKAACISVEPPRDPPDSAPQPDAKKNERQSQQKQNVAGEVPHFPCRHAAGLAQKNAFHCQRESGDTIRKRSVADVPAGCQISSQRRRSLPQLATAACIRIILPGQRLSINHPQTLQGKYTQHGSSQYLRFVDFKSRRAHAAVAEFTRERWKTTPYRQLPFFSGI